MSDINIKIIKYKRFNGIEFHIGGKRVNYVVVNTLRRIIQYIPCYAWDDFKFSHNTSIFNNDNRKAYITNIAVPNMNKKDTTHLYNKIINDELKDEDIDKMTMSIQAKNKGIDVLNVISNKIYCKFYMNETEVENIYNKEHLLIELKPNEKFSMTCSTNLNIGLHNIKYSPITTCVYEEKDDNNYIMKFASRGQIDEVEVMKRGCKILHIKLDNIKELIDMADLNLEDTHGKIIMENENHTMGNFINRYLQDHEDIRCGYMMDHLLINNITIKYIIDGSKNIKEIFNDCFNLMKKDISNIEKLFNL